jgi:hypothetical protein
MAMRFLITGCLLLSVIAAHAQESEGYDEYAAGMESKRTKLPTNVHHKINQPISKAKRQLTQQLDAAHARMQEVESKEVNTTYSTSDDILNYGGLTVKGNTPIKANNIVIVSRPGGMNGLEGNHVRPTHVRVQPVRPASNRPTKD